MSIVQVVIDSSTDKVIKGKYDFDRANGGILTVPAGSSFPGTPSASELFWRTDEKKLYRRTDANDGWDMLEASAISHSMGGTSHDADTLANVNTKISDATLIDTNDSRLSNERTDGAAIHDNVVGEVNAITAKTVPAATDIVLLEDSAASWAKKKMTLRDLRKYAQEVHVAKEGGDFTSIQAALDSITDAAFDKRYVVVIHAGDYAENVTTKSYVELWGVGEHAPRIRPTSGVALTLAGAKDYVHNLTAEPDYGTLTSAETVLLVSSGEHEIDHCEVSATREGGNYAITAIAMTGGVLQLENTEVEYAIEGGNSGGIEGAIKLSGVSVCSIVGCAISGTISGTSDIVALLQTVTGSSATFVTAATNVILNNQGTGICAGLYLSGGSTGVSVVQCNWVITSNTADAYGGYINSSGNNAVVHTSFNNITISSGGNAYAGLIASGDTWASHFDIIGAPDGTTGAGDVEFVSFDHSNGLFLLNHPVTDGTASFTVAEAETAYDHTALTNNPHGTDVENLGAGTLAELNSAITDATLIDTADSRLSDNRTDGDAIHDNVSAEISALTEKTTPVNADLLIIEDSAASNAKKKIQIGNLPSGGGGGGIEQIYYDTYTFGVQTTSSTAVDARSYAIALDAGDYEITTHMLGWCSATRDYIYTQLYNSTSATVLFGSTCHYQADAAEVHSITHAWRGTLTAATHTFKIRYYQAGGGTANLDDIRFSIKKIG